MPEPIAGLRRHDRARRAAAHAHCAERLERRRLLTTLAVDGTAGPDLITVALAPNGGIVVEINGGQTLYDSPTFTALSISGSDGHDTLRMDGVGDLSVTIDGGAGDDTFIVGGGDVDLNISAAVSVVGGAGTDSLIVNDAFDDAGDDAVTIANPINTYVSLAKPAGGTILADVSNDRVALELIRYLGSDTADLIEILGTSALATLEVAAGGGDDSVRIGDDLDSQFNASLSIDGGGGVNVVTFDDSSDSGGDTYWFGGEGSIGTLHKSSGGLPITYQRFDALLLRAGSAGTTFPNNQTFAVTSMPATTSATILAGTGDDSLRWGDATVNIDAPDATLTFDGEGGIDRIDYTDVAGDVARSYGLLPTAVTRVDARTLSYWNTESMLIRSGGASDEFHVLGTAVRLNVTLSGGDGNDTFRVGNGDVDATVGNSVSILGGAGDDRLLIDDTTDDVGNDTYTFISGQLNRAQRAVLWSTTALDAVEDVSLAGSAHADTVRVGGANATVRLTIDSGGGSDELLIDRTSEGFGAAATAVSITSGAGDDSLTVNGDFAGADAVVALPAEVESLASLTVRAGGTVVVPSGPLDAHVIHVRSQITVDGIIDLNDQTLIVTDAARFALLNTAAAAGYNGGTWTGASGAALISTAASQSPFADGLAVVTAASVGSPIYGGVQTASGDVIVRHALAGDANVDGSVGFDDLLSLAQNYGASDGGRTWRQGNFDYSSTPGDAAVGFDDLLVFAQNYGRSLTPVLPLARVVTTQRRSR